MITLQTIIELVIELFLNVIAGLIIHDLTR